MPQQCLWYWVREAMVTMAQSVGIWAQATDWNYLMTANE